MPGGAYVAFQSPRNRVIVPNQFIDAGELPEGHVGFNPLEIGS